MLKIKDEFSGFVYNDVYGYVEYIFNKEYTEKEWELISLGVPENHILFTKFDDGINNFFEINSVEELNEDVYLREVLDFI